MRGGSRGERYGWDQVSDLGGSEYAGGKIRKSPLQKKAGKCRRNVSAPSIRRGKV